ncbi:MAG: hypothetical protein HYY20_08865 [Candidatus Tectomicrobia bacterium]|uniref:Doubled CXXCH motif domain-containing protein n=1 Tax=Tectimicrobiota bacterium TaxID=2528274 RepID=A0A932CP59_UNCTE|nr:hypothetical protein [Candidatus Tectomicrobia bacterium]
MTDRRWTLAIAVLLAMAVLTFWAGSAQALHKSSSSGRFDCDGCHAMHQSYGTDGGYGGSLEYYNQWEAWGVGTNADTNYGRRLLKTRRSSYLCLQCHDRGTNQTGGGRVGLSNKIVVDTTQPNGKPATNVGAGGYFYGMTSLPTVEGGGFDNGNAHAVDAAIPGHPESTESETEVLWCRKCHHHHGTGATDTSNANLPNGDPVKPLGLKVSAFRNLIVRDADNVVGREIDPSGQPTNSYYTEGLELFCQRCHDLNTWSALGDAYHPVGSNTRISIAGLAAGTNYESGMDDTDTFTGQPIIKPQDPSGTDNRTAGLATRDPGDDDNVTCLTCHYAHGGPYEKMLRWDYGNYLYTWSDPNSDTTGVRKVSGVPTDPAAGCQMCHAR